MEKIKLGVVFGGESTENEVSVVSANSILNNLDTEKYDIYPIYIDKEGTWWEYEKQNNIKLRTKIRNKKLIENERNYLNQLDVIFPVLHGKYGEDGTIQGFFELVGLPYVGCHVLSSSIGMDKAYSKIIFEKAGLKQADYEYIRKYKDKYLYVNKNFEEEILSLEAVAKKVSKELKYPMFVKPSNAGSSVGINKAKNFEQLKDYIEIASQFDNKILIEQGINGREIECAVLGNEDVITSCVGEIKPAEEFYSYNAKYSNKESKIEIPADLPKEILEEIRKQAIKAFKAIDGKGLARVDFFVERKSNDIYINEINTMPGFTNISMYPKLFEKSGISYKELLSRLVNLSFEES
ncbi:MAG: D-alanine--D-alanine ligase family protein [Clostridia bacterium]|nr:D-alanine--D-alanine ligase family protein [Clostridia bacterium]